MRARLGRAFGRSRDRFPLTALGVAVALLSGTALAFGVASVDLVLLGAGVIGLVALLVSLTTVIAGALRMRSFLRRRPKAESALSLECGYAVRTGFRLPRLRWIPGVRVSWRWVAPSARVRQLVSGGWLEEEAVPTTRAQRDALVRAIEIGDAFGLAAIGIEQRETRALRVLPSVGGLRQMHVVRTLSGGSDDSHPEGSPDGERLDLRAYTPGDPIKYVLWSVFARTRELVVRTPERAVSAAKKTLAYLVAGAGDEPAAGAARVALDAGALGGDFAFGADGVEEAAQTLEAALEALARSADAPRELAGRGLARFVEQAAATKAGRALVFVPGKPGPWLEGLLASAARIPPDAAGRVPLEFVVCTDGVERARATRFVRRLALATERRDDATDAAVHADELARVVSTLGRLRARVLVVDRRDGRVQVAGG